MKASLIRKQLKAHIHVAKRDLARSGQSRSQHPDAIHGVRVTARRLREYCLVMKRRRLVRHLTWLIRKLGPMRDLDVAGSVRHSKSKAHWLADERVEEAHRVLATLRSPKTQRLVSALGDLPALRKKQTTKRMRRLERNVNSQDRDLRQVEDVHSLRRTLRHLRYCREWAGLDVKPLQVLQARLGKIIDLAMRVSQAKGFLASQPRDQAAAARTVKLRQTQLGRALARMAVADVQL